MARLLGSWLGSVALTTSLLSGLAGCSLPAHADQVAVPAAASAGRARIAIGIAPAQVRAPYDVQVIRESGEQLATYAARDRFYVQGNAGERYVIRVTNPTPNRVEAVVSVDGLDVVDGEAGDLRKRGYVIQPYGEVRIEGFRTSHHDVATFRFSSVDGSYAGLKGKARNVGVIAVAIFEEDAVREEPQLIGGGGPGLYEGRDGEADDAAEAAPTSTARGGAPAKSLRSRPSPPPPASPSVGSAVREKREAPRDESTATYDGDAAPAARPTYRPGLGTEFGESRTSSASYTQFERAGDRPIAIAELRYNDASGLLALGIRLQPTPDTSDVMTRETADPFPGDGRFAAPPR